ncbi:MAG TPA: lysozyme inhibitor LprI family protein [Thermoanaerobaculia bacterium]|nr:lysozyme inhibitor LprI family protein [Thermoanaerobaculia bacterium]
MKRFVPIAVMTLVAALIAVPTVRSHDVGARGATTAVTDRATPRRPGCGEGVVESLVCADAEVGRLDDELNTEWKRLSCSGAAQTEFRAEERFWLRDRNNCQNVAAVRDCVLGKLRERIAFLRRLGSCTDERRFIRYDFTDPWYVTAHEDLYVGTKVTIFGSLHPSSCRASSSSASGIIVPTKARDGRFRVRLKSLPPEQRAFLCTKRPAAHWYGEVRRDSHGPYLYLADVLGVPLP